MVRLPDNEKDLTFILNQGTVTEPRDRDYLGFSSIGDPCHRAIQYNWRFASTKAIPVRFKRIYSLGHTIEQIVIADLKKAGIKITNDQKEVVGFAGHWKGHIDGEATNVPAAPIVKHLLEIKSMKGELFKILCKKGVKVSNPEHYAQMQMYMHYGKYSRALYVCYDKNTSAYYTERIRPDPDVVAELRKKETEIIFSEHLHPRIGNDSPQWFECVLCDHKSVCFNFVPVLENCRTCKNVDIHENCRWRCTIKRKDLTLDEQIKGCDDYKKDEMFITLKEIVG